MTNEIKVDAVKILRAFKSGDVVFLECGGHISAESYKRFMDQIGALLEGTGVRVVLLGDGIRVAAAEETIDTSHLASPQ
jgi:hypothetical protein